MRLRRQLLLLGLVFLLLPIAGFLFIREVEQLLRLGQEQAVIANARAIADRITTEPTLYDSLAAQNSGSAAGSAIYVVPTNASLSLDGYEDDWQFLKLVPQTFSSSTLRFSSMFVSNNSGLFGFLSINDTSYDFYDPQLSRLQEDFIVISVGEDEQRNHYLLRTGAPGTMQIVEIKSASKQRLVHNIQAVWRQTAAGYQVELLLPPQWLAKPLAIGVYDNTQALGVATIPSVTGDPEHWLNSVVSQKSPKLLTIDRTLQNVAKVFTHPNNRVRVVNRNGWVLADENKLSANTVSSQPLSWVIRSILNSKNLPNLEREKLLTQLKDAEITTSINTKAPTSRWYHWNQSNNLVRVVYPIVSPDVSTGALEAPETATGAIVIEQTTLQWLALADEAFKRLFFYSIVVLVVVGAVLLFYASWLSFRVRKLSVSAQRAINSDGSIARDFPNSRMKDEIGDLNRSYRELLSRIGEYNDYLKTLADKLSHELRTPLAIVKSSLDNLQTCSEQSEREAFLARAQSGADRLSNILTAMNSAKRIEEAISQAELEAIDITQLVAELGSAYVRLTHDKPFSVTVAVAQEPIETRAAPDLIVQMLDKLFDNAVSFCDDNGRIHIAVSRDGQDCLIRVDNTGPSLPPHMLGQIFSSMVSLREKQSGSTHLGLGLFIVKLIVDYHRGEVRAFNREDGNGAVFEVRLPIF